MLYKPEKCPHPMLAKREQKLLCGKLQAEMKKRDIGYLILRNPANVFYATGYAPLVGSGVAVVPVEGDPYLLISTLESAEAYAQPRMWMCVSLCPGCLSTTEVRSPVGTKVM